MQFFYIQKNILKCASVLQGLALLFLTEVVVLIYRCRTHGVGQREEKAIRNVPANVMMSYLSQDSTELASARYFFSKFPLTDTCNIVSNFAYN